MQKKAKEKNDLLKNMHKNCLMREIKLLIFKTKEKKESGEKLDENNCFRDIENESEALNYDLLEK